MKKVPSWAAIIAIPTAITGFFGQNMTSRARGPWSGLYLSLSLIVVTSLVLSRAFKHRDWLSSGSTGRTARARFAAAPGGQHRASSRPVPG